MRAPPTYVWTLSALLLGIVAGGIVPDQLAPVAVATAGFIRLVVTLVPILIVAALSPAIATLVRRGLAGKFATAVVGWYVLSSTLAGLFGLLVSSLVFGIPLTTEGGTAYGEAVNMLSSLRQQSGASAPLLAIVVAVLLGVLAGRLALLATILAKVEKGLSSAGRGLGYAMIPVVMCLGITVGVQFGARLGMGHYLTMTLYTALLCWVWWLFYVFVIIKYVAKRPVRRVVTDYYLPTAIFAAGTCSSLATLPVNLTNVRRLGVRNEVADFVLPFGAVANLDASALAYVAYAPFILSHIFGIEISWAILLIAWPAIVLFTIAAPGLPAGMGTALWSSTLFASMLGLEEPLRTNFITTWIALAGGLPDMLRTATNCTGDGFTAIVFDRWFGRFA